VPKAELITTASSSSSHETEFWPQKTSTDDETATSCITQTREIWELEYGQELRKPRTRIAFIRYFARMFRYFVPVFLFELFAGFHEFGDE
jgi:hypothetical protein